MLQFHGCFWHGCATCFQINRDRTLSFANRGDTIDTRYEQTLATTWRLRQRGYHVTEKWECDFDREMNKNPEMRNFLENHPMIKIALLDPRDAFFGGRTMNIIFRYEVTGENTLRERVFSVPICIENGCISDRTS